MTRRSSCSTSRPRRSTRWQSLNSSRDCERSPSDGPFCSFPTDSRRYVSADRILVFDKGCLIEVGNHDELMARNGHYAEMFTVQASPYSAS